MVVPPDHSELGSHFTKCVLTSALDTNLLQEHWREQKKAAVVEKLIHLAEISKIELYVTARIHEDIPRPPLSEKIAQLQELHVNKTGSVIRVGYWRVGRDMVGNRQFNQFHEDASRLVAQRGKNPPDWRDWDHLHVHYLLRHNIFLTWDGGILCLAAELFEKFGVVVKSPEEFLESDQ